MVDHGGAIGHKSKFHPLYVVKLCLRLYDSIVSELDLLSLKHGGSSIDAYDFVSTLGSGLRKHTETLTQQLQELYRYLNGVTDGHREPMFYTLLLAIIEPPNAVSTPQHKMLPAMVSYLLHLIR